MYKNKKVTAIILCAGSGERFGKETNKVYKEIKDKPIMAYSMEKFSNNKYIDSLIIVTKLEEKEECSQIAKKYCNIENKQIIYGGKERQDSVYNALKVADGEIVIIHDGARPLVTDKMINDCIEAVDSFDGVTVGVKSKDTIKIANNEGTVLSTTERKNTWIIQTPQCFNKEILLKGHNLAKEQGKAVTDDCMIIENMGKKVKIIEGEYTNIKVTVPEDIQLIEGFLSQ